MAVIGPTIESTLDELNGEAVGATAVYYVLDVSVSPILEQALAAAGVPQPGDSLNQANPLLKVKERSAQIVGVDEVSGKHKVRIVVTYELDRPEAEAGFSLRGGATLNQIETEKDRAGNPITLTYKDQTVRATVNVTQVLAHFQVELVEETNDPDGVVAMFIDHVNSAQFRGKPAGTWLCTDVQYEPRDLSNPQSRWYRFTYEFSNKPEGWVYTVFFKDENDYIPEDVVEGLGIKDIDWHPRRDFSQKFGA